MEDAHKVMVLHSIVITCWPVGDDVALPETVTVVCTGDEWFVVNGQINSDNSPTSGEW